MFLAVLFFCKGKVEHKLLSMDTKQTKISIDEVIKPFYDETLEYGPEAKMNWDGARAHCAKETQNYLLKNNIKRFKYSGHPMKEPNGFPPNSPDLHPIEYIFANIDHRVKVQHPKTVFELIKTVQQEWNNLSLEEIRGAYGHLKKVHPYVLKHHGELYQHSE